MSTRSFMAAMIAAGLCVSLASPGFAAKVRTTHVGHSTRHVSHTHHAVHTRHTTVVHHHHVAVVRPVRPLVWRPYYGTVVAGVALGTVIVATTVAVVPKAPAPNLCWYWADAAKVKGYWDYCK
jgi:hypothetical protein